MVPHVAARGSSFKGAGLYYLHDKSARTSERVAWVQTHNVPTKAPDKALKWMAYTAINADRIKAEYGGSKAGAKSKGKPVYSYSLSWHEGDQPDHKEMQGAVMETLERLGLKEHEAVIVAHQDTGHPHVHVVCNLVHPKTGRIKSMSNDHLKLSRWAQEHDLRHGRDHCPERIRNNQERSRRELTQEFNAQQQKEGPNNQPKRKFVKHRKQEDPRSQIIQELYNQSDSGKAFKAALQEQGYTLAQGHKGRMVLVNEQGQVYALARQLKGQRARDIKARLKDIDFKSLPMAKELVEQRLYFDRDKYASEQQEKIEAAAIEAEKKRMVIEKASRKANDQRTVKPKIKENFQEAREEPTYDDSHLIRLDSEMVWSKYEQRKRLTFDDRMKELYGRKKLAKRIERLNEQIENKNGLWDKLRGKKRELEERRGILKKELTHIDQVISGYRATLEREIRVAKAQYFKGLAQDKSRDQQPKQQQSRKDKNRDQNYTLDR